MESSGQQDREHLLACLALSTAEISSRAWILLSEHCGGAQQVLAIADSDLGNLRGISVQVRSRVAVARTKLPGMEQALARLEDLDVKLYPLDHPLYPPLLKQIPDPPCLLYVRGELKEQDRFSIAIVGSRSPRPYGLQMARKLGADLAKAGLTIVSGGARGIDAAAHEGALKAGGRTIAVLGCGIDISYPSEHKELFARIAEQGAVATEYPLGAAPESWRFPRRNRIISGLSRGVVVCDAPQDSGALITATCAVEQNRDVFAVPGNVDTEHNRGAHSLLKDGAKLVESADDVLSEYGLDSVSEEGTAQELPRIQVSSEERLILEMLDLEPLLLDSIIDRSGLGASDVSGLLTFLEMKRLVKRVAGPAYVRVLK